MEEGGLVLCDTNILIELYKGNLAIVKSLKSINQDNLSISIITVGEMLHGALNKKELTQIKKDLNQLRVFGIDDKVCNEFMRLMMAYSLSHGLSLPDGLIAATSIVHKIPFYTLNRKDFKFIPELELWS